MLGVAGCRFYYRQVRSGPFAASGRRAATGP